jgi:hypothetical protein
VNPSRNEYAFFGEGLLRLRVLVLGRYGEEFALIASQSPAQSISIEEVLGIGVLFNAKNVIVKV